MNAFLREDYEIDRDREKSLIFFGHYQQVRKYTENIDLSITA
jgi:hypothetical protein